MHQLFGAWLYRQDCSLNARARYIVLSLLSCSISTCYHSRYQWGRYSFKGLCSVAEFVLHSNYLVLEWKNHQKSRTLSIFCLHVCLFEKVHSIHLHLKTVIDLHLGLDRRSHRFLGRDYNVPLRYHICLRKP